MSDSDDKREATIHHNPFASAVDRMLRDKAARPQDVYRLAVILQAVLDSLDKPEALETIKFELRVLINDMSQMGHDDPDA
jgi:hypothetical protein